LTCILTQGDEKTFLDSLRGFVTTVYFALTGEDSSSIALGSSWLLASHPNLRYF